MLDLFIYLFFSVSYFVAYYMMFLYEPYAAPSIYFSYGNDFVAFLMKSFVYMIF